MASSKQQLDFNPDCLGEFIESMGQALFSGVMVPGARSATGESSSASILSVVSAFAKCAMSHKQDVAKQNKLFNAKAKWLSRFANQYI